MDRTKYEDWHRECDYCSDPETEKTLMEEHNIKRIKQEERTTQNEQKMNNYLKKNKLVPLDDLNDKFELDDEDKEWLNDPPVGREKI